MKKKTGISKPVEQRLEKVDPTQVGRLQIW